MIVDILIADSVSRYARHSIMDLLEDNTQEYGNFMIEMASPPIARKRNLTDESSEHENEEDVDLVDSQEQIETFLQENRNERTVKKTKIDIDQFQNFILEK